MMMTCSGKAGARLPGRRFFQARVRRWACLGTAALLLLGARTAWAHAELLRSTPAADAMLTSAPQRISIWFSEPVETVADAISVYTPDGVRTDRGAAIVSPDDSTLLTVGLEPRGAGTYSVRWSVMSADGHPVRGSFSFSIGTPSATPPAAVPEAVSTTAVLAVQSVGRWLHLAAVAAIIGPIVLLALTTPTGGDKTIEQNLWRMATAGGIVALPAAVLLLLGQQAGLRGSFTGILSSDGLQSLLATRWGTIWIIRLVAAALLIVATWIASRTAAAASRAYGGRLLLGAGLVTLIVATSLNGHSAAAEPIPLSVGVDAIHLAATGAWVGGLFGLGLVFLPAVRRAPVERGPALAQIVPRFSVVALVAVELLILTGLYHSWAHVEEPAALTSTPYGRALLVKIALIAGILLPAAFNLLVVRPKIAALAGRDPLQGQWVRRLGAAVAGEMLLATAILAMAALLTALPPARTLAAATDDVPEAEEKLPAITLAENAGSVLVTLTISPVRLGANRILIALRDSGGATPGNLQPRLRIEPPAQSGVAAWTVVPAPEADGLAAMVSLAPAGRWTLGVQGIGESNATFAIDVPALEPGQLLERADRAMNQLRTLEEDVEDVTPAGTTKSHAAYQAPDRIRRQSSDAAEVVVGAVRYLRHGAMWHEEAAQPITWPAFAIAASAADVSMLGIERLDDVPCAVLGFVNTRENTRDRIWVALDTWRVRKRIAVAAGRTRVTVYSAFDRKLDIIPPK